MSYYFVVFFFSSRRRHTRFDCDWSSDVCSSDLAEKDYHLALYLLGGLAALAVALGTVLAWAITRSITEPLRMAVSVVDTVAHGDLTANIVVQGKDEPAQLLSAMSSMNDKLREIMEIGRAHV